MNSSGVESARGYGTPGDTPDFGQVRRSSPRIPGKGESHNEDNGRVSFVDGDEGAGSADQPVVKGTIGLPRVDTTSSSFPKLDMDNLSRETTIPTNDKPPVAIESPFEAPSWAKAAFAKYEKVVKLQDRFLTDQSRLKSERDTAIAAFHRLRDSRAQYRKLLKPGKGKKNGVALKASRKAAYEQLVADEQAVEDQMHLVIKLEQSLGKLEYRLGRLLSELLDVVGSCFPNTTPKRLESLSGKSSRSRSPVSPVLDPLEDAYYNQRGKVRLLHDRLLTHLAEWQHSADDEIPENFTSTQANPSTLATETSAFHSQRSAVRDRWRTEYETLQQQLLLEEKELKRLWDACQATQIDVGELPIEHAESPKATAQSPHVEAEQDVVKLDAPPFLRLDSDGMVSRLFKDFRWPTRGGFVPPLFPDVQDLAGKREFIENWVGKIPDTIFGSGDEPSAATERGSLVPPSFPDLPDLASKRDFLESLVGKIPDLILGSVGEQSAATPFAHTVGPSKHERDWQTVDRAQEDVTKDYVIIHSEQTTTPSEDGLKRRGSRKVLRRWKSDDALTDSTRRDSQPRLNSGDIQPGVTRRRS